MSLKNVVITVEQEGKQIEKFKVDLPNLLSLRGFLQGFWDFEVYNSVFPGKNKLSDVDGSIELNGHTLHIEFKASTWALDKDKGQKLKAVRQAKHSNVTTIFVIGKTNKPEHYKIFSPQIPEGTQLIPCTVEILRDVMDRWVKYSKENNLVESRKDDWNLVQKS